MVYYLLQPLPPRFRFNPSPQPPPVRHRSFIHPDQALFVWLSSYKCNSQLSPKRSFSRGQQPAYYLFHIFLYVCHPPIQPIQWAPFNWSESSGTKKESNSRLEGTQLLEYSVSVQGPLTQFFFFNFLSAIWRLNLTYSIISLLLLFPLNSSARKHIHKHKNMGA